MEAAGNTAAELVLTRVFAAPRALVFRMWTTPEHAARWWAPKGFTLLSCQLDVRPGGAWRRQMRAPDGAERWCRGVYREVVEPERLSFTYRWDDADGPETLVTVTFAELGDRTQLTLWQTGFATEYSRDDHRGGWSGCFERFADYFATVPKEA
jgi:uncharacterized protein YndB with AHSA1/START domain